MLSENTARPKRERLTMMRTFEDLRSLGYEGGYDAVRRHAACWAKKRDAASPATVRVPQSFDPGKAYQFDWSPEDVVLGGKAVHEGCACVSLPQPDVLYGAYILNYTKKRLR